MGNMAHEDIKMNKIKAIQNKSKESLFFIFCKLMLFLICTINTD